MEIGNILECAVRIVRETGEFTQNAVNMFEILGDIKEDYQEVIRYKLKDRTIENLCCSILHSSYVVLKCCLASLAKTVRDLQHEKEKLPKRFQPKVREIRSYFASIEEKLGEVDATVADIRTKASRQFALIFSSLRRYTNNHVDMLSPGGVTWVNFCWVCAAGLSEPITHYSLVYSVVKYRPHLSYFWENVIFTIPPGNFLFTYLPVKAFYLGHTEMN